jgi:hypothetical protein
VYVFTAWQRRVTRRLDLHSQREERERERGWRVVSFEDEADFRMSPTAFMDDRRLHAAYSVVFKLPSICLTRKRSSHEPEKNIYIIYTYKVYKLSFYHTIKLVKLLQENI